MAMGMNEFTVVWDMSPERMEREGLYWLLRDHPKHPLFGLSRRGVRRWRRNELKARRCT